jgi:predicted extracellular nuclease
LTPRTGFLAATLVAIVSGVPPVTADEAPLAVHMIQGPGATSPYEGRRVTVHGIVTGDFQDYGKAGNGRLGGFYIASLEPDADPATSEGLFVFEKGARLGDVRTGNIVEVGGVVQEFYGETQLVADAVRVRGSDTVRTNDIVFPVEDFERYEGMLLRIREPMLIAGNHDLERFGTLTIAAGGRPYQFTNENRPDRRGYREAEAEARAHSLILDDGFRSENRQPVRYLGLSPPPRAGNALTGLTGNLRWSRGSGGKGDPAYRLMPTADVSVLERNSREFPRAREGNLRVVSFNVLNLFEGLGNGRPICGPKGNADCRGADTALERDRQLAKIVTALALLDADIVALAELENDARDSLDLLVSALGAAGLDYEYVDAGTIGSDAIKVGLLFRPSRVRTVGRHQILDRRFDGRFDSSRNRPALAQRFALVANDAKLLVVANHLKSKGSDCDEVNDPNRGDGQGNCNVTRTRAAVALADFVHDARDNDKALVMGDFNAYLLEDPIRALTDAGFVNLLAAEKGTRAYTYVFRGQAGALDYAFASAALAREVRQGFAWHSNADEPPLFDYNLDRNRDPAIFDGATPWRSSDHDPVVVDIDLRP